MTDPHVKKLTNRTVLLAIGAILGLALPGLTSSDNILTWTVPIVLGIAFLALAIGKSGFWRPFGGWLAVTCMNLGFWLSWILWQAKGLLRPSEQGGIDPFAGPLSISILLFLTSSAYEIVVFGKGVFTDTLERRACLMGLVVVLVQWFTSLLYAWHLVQGV